MYDAFVHVSSKSLSREEGFTCRLAWVFIVGLECCINYSRRGRLPLQVSTTVCSYLQFTIDASVEWLNG